MPHLSTLVHLLLHPLIYCTIPQLHLQSLYHYNHSTLEIVHQQHLRKSANTTSTTLAAPSTSSAPNNTSSYTSPRCSPSGSTTSALSFPSLRMCASASSSPTLSEERHLRRIIYAASRSKSTMDRATAVLANTSQHISPFR